MRLRDHHRPAAVLLATLAVTVGLAACGSSDASGDSTPAPAATTATPAVTTPVATEPATTTPDATAAPEITAATSPPATEPTTSDAGDAVVVTDAEVADLEKQLDEIDELLKGVDADLSQD